MARQMPHLLPSGSWLNWWIFTLSKKKKKLMQCRCLTCLNDKTFHQKRSRTREQLYLRRMSSPALLPSHFLQRRWNETNTLQWLLVVVPVTDYDWFWGWDNNNFRWHRVKCAAHLTILHLRSISERWEPIPEVTEECEELRVLWGPLLTSQSFRHFYSHR